MSCADLVSTFNSLRVRCGKSPAFGAVTRCMTRDRRLRWRMPSGGYTLNRGLTAETIDYDYPVGIATSGSQITEMLTARPVSTGDLYYAVRGFGPLGVDDGASPPDSVPDSVKVELVGGVVQLPKPFPPVLSRVEPIAGGKFRVIARVDNIDVATPAASLVIYTDGGTGTMDWGTPVGIAITVGDGRGDYQGDFDPALPHATALKVGVRSKSAAGAESDNTNTHAVILDSQGPAAIVELTVEAVC